ncbi:MAG: helicase [Gammaproteobacteria bacterium]|nr:helicase [Gammaproteobacteria bacterium]MBU2066935.1 helicase [Gammaproteobacteria bacterium]MBU2139668.1 helicase [Gammaproteobacteria bacterium]MBU2217770.1 helicase [Gammaproteobacteria bacterium]MBU2324491.1 helicase [Gammaproteobacteria bacterium]
MKFRFLLWMLGRLMAKASRDNPAFQKQLEGRDLVFQLHTLDGRIARHFIVKDLRISSRRGPASEPAFALGFKDAAYGFATLTAKNKQLAFMQGIQNKDIQIQGNPALVLWFQGLTKYLSPKKKPSPQKAA